jgi:hypothetical protein
MAGWRKPPQIQPPRLNAAATTALSGVRGGTGMRLVVYLLAIVCAIAAIMYITTQAGSLPTFMPGYAAGSARIHSTHALAAAIAAVVLFIIGWAVGRSRA